MRRAFGLPLLLLVAVLVAPDATVAEPIPWPLVVGTGNRVSGSVSVLLLGNGPARLAADVRALARHVAGRCDLRVEVRAAKTLDGKFPTAPIVVVTSEIATADAALLARHREVGRGLVLDLRPDSVPAIQQAVTLPGGAEVHASEQEPGLFRAGPGKDIGPLVLGVLRVGVRQGHIPHRLSAFSRVDGRLADGRLVLACETALPGRITLDALTLDGDEILPAGPLRPVPLDRGEETIVRLRFEGENGLTDEARYWLPDLAPGMMPRVRVLGARRIAVGEPLHLRVLVHDSGGRPIAGCVARAAGPGGSDEARTDAHGAATVSLPPCTEVASVDPVIALTVTGERFERGYRLPVGVSKRPVVMAVETDRPVVRPGDSVQVRAVFLDALTRSGLEGRSVEFKVEDPRGRVIDGFTGTTDRFGTASFTFPISGRGAEGAYEVRVEAGKTKATRSFRVEPVERPPFEIEIALDRSAVAAGEDVTGAVEVRTFDGVPLPGVALSVEWRGRTLPLDGDAAHRAIRLRTADLKPGRVGLTVVGRHAGALVRRQTIVSIVPPTPSAAGATGAAMIEAPETAVPGRPLALTVRAPDATGVAYLDLVGGGRILASGACVLADGVGSATLDLPDHYLGTARLHLHGRGLRADRRITIARPGLRVSVTPSAEVARPGEAAAIRCGVRDESGVAVPALLDVVALDEAYRSVADDAAPAIPELLSGGTTSRALPVRIDDRSSRALDGLADRIEEEADPALEAARTALLAGKPITRRTPWGTRVIAVPMRRGAMLWAEPAVTIRPPGARGHIAAAPATAAWDATPPAGLRDRFVLAPHLASRPRKEPIGAGDMSLDWLLSHQSRDGGLHPDEFWANCDCEACDGLGDPALRPGTTALALLAWLGAGETHKTGRYRVEVKAALKHLVRHQRPDGFIGDPTGPFAILNHAMATTALSEAYALTGSPLFKRPAQRAVTALATVQRDDGGFAEKDWSDPSLVLTAWATMAFKPAKEAGGIRFDRNVFARIGACADAYADPETGAIRASADEIAKYPFPETDRARNRAAMTTLIRLFLGGDGRGDWSAPLRETMIADLPEWPIRDFQGAFFGSIACFQLGGEVWKAWNVSMKGAIIDNQRRDGCAKGSWDVLAGSLGRVGTTAFGVMCLEVYYRYSRVFGTRGGFRRQAPRARSEFPDVLFSDLAHPTADDGTAIIDVTLPDSVTTWAVSVGAWDGRGRYGRSTAAIRARLPLHLAADLPTRLLVGDRIDLPIRVRSTLDAATTCRVAIVAGEGFEVLEGEDQEITVPASGMAAAHVSLRATRPGRTTLRIRAESPEHDDALALPCDIRPVGVPFLASAPLAPGGRASLADRVPDDVDSLRLRLLVCAGPEAAADLGLAGLIRRPVGCFEQTSATLYPALLAYRVLEKRSLLDDKRAKRALDHLRTGYQAILSFENEDGGFSLFRGGMPRADLTALGIHQLLDLSKILVVDTWVIESAAFWLSEHLPTHPAERLYALGALHRTELEADTVPAARKALTLADPYAVALAVVHGLVPERDRPAARTILEAAAVETANGAHWSTKRQGLFIGGPASIVETTGLVVLALVKTGGRPDLIAGGLRTLRTARRPDGAWRTTRDTVAALRALVETPDGLEQAQGTLTVTRDGEAPIIVDLDGTGGMSAIPLGQVSADAVVTATFSGRGQPWLTLTGSSATAKALAAPGPVDLTVTWPEKPLALGDLASLLVTIRNRADAAIGSPTAEINLPAGLAVSGRALSESARRDGFSHAEVREGRIHLYLGRLASGDEITLTVPVRGARTGLFHTGASRAYPYYEPDRATVRPDSAVSVTDPDRD